MECKSSTTHYCVGFLHFGLASLDQSLPFQRNGAIALLLGAFCLLSRCYPLHLGHFRAYSSPSIVLAARGAHDREGGLSTVSSSPKASSKQMKGNAMIGVDKVRNEDKFDLGAPPPFRITEIRATIPSHCWVKNLWRSISYVIRDVIVGFGLAALANFFDSWVVWPFY